LIGCPTTGWKVVANRELVEELRPLIAKCATFHRQTLLGRARQPVYERADKPAVAVTMGGAVETSGSLQPRARC
jgi:hypothetical protein